MTEDLFDAWRRQLQLRCEGRMLITDICYFVARETVGQHVDRMLPMEASHWRHLFPLSHPTMTFDDLRHAREIVAAQERKYRWREPRDY